MQIRISGKHIDTGDALRQHVADRLGEAVDKYFDRAVEAHVTFTREGAAYRADCSVHLPTGLRLQSQGSAHDIHPAFDDALQRMDKQLRRYKRRLRDHHASQRSAPATFIENVIEPEAETEEAAESYAPIIAETTATAPSFSIGEAVMQLDLAESPVVVFRHERSGRINFVYRRPDGAIGWIDPTHDGA